MANTPVAGMQRILRIGLLFICLLHLSSAFLISVGQHVRTSSVARVPTPTAVAVESESSSSRIFMNKPVYGRWEEVNGNFILRPKIDDGPPRAVLHFLGGAIVGAVPHVSYRYILERLAEHGYLVVATPYNLSFDHLDTCDEIISRFETVAPSLARQYGAIPVVGVGHSCGALLQLLITSLFPDTPRAANALISFNNKPVKDAVPFFEEFFAPFFTSVASRNNDDMFSGLEVINVGLQLARSASEGGIPSDELVTQAKQILTPGPLRNVLVPHDLLIPAAVRTGLQTLINPTATALASAGVLPLLNHLVDTLDQIPLLIEEVAEGARDFVPPPSSVSAAARRAYRARRTLILQYDDDSFDESDQIEELLKEAVSVTRMKRPMIEIEVQRRKIKGVHASPLLAPPLEIVSRAEDILGKDAARESLQYTQADETVSELVRWLEEANL